MRESTIACFYRMPAFAGMTRIDDFPGFRTVPGILSLRQDFMGRMIIILSLPISQRKLTTFYLQGDIMQELLTNFTALPNLHPAIVHFPIALLSLAFALDVFFLIFKRPAWLDHAATLTYILGTLGATAAYFAGRQAADSVENVLPQAQLAMGIHSDWALYTLLAFFLVSVLRLVISRPGAAARAPFRFGATVLGAVAVGMLLRTADLGGSLVFKYGVTVRAPQSAQRTAMPETSTAAPETRLVRSDDGSLLWQPAPGDSSALTNLLEPLTSGSLRAVPAAPVQGLSLQVAGKSFLLFRDTLADLQIDAEVVLQDYRGQIGLAYRTRDGDNSGLFVVSTSGKAQLLDIDDGQAKVLDADRAALPGGPVKLTVSAAGAHLKGFVDGKQVTHGHIHEQKTGRFGLFFDGTGTVRIVQVNVSKLEAH